MIEGSLYDRELAALAIKQARGDLIEAIFLARAYRTTLPRFGATRPIDTGAMTIRRRVSATFKDVPGGQILGATFDYTHRLLDFDLATEPAERSPSGADDTESRLSRKAAPGGDLAAPVAHLGSPGRGPPRLMDSVGGARLIGAEGPGPGRRAAGDLAREPLDFPAGRDVRLQSLARADEGFVLALGYATQRGYGRN